MEKEKPIIKTDENKKEIRVTVIRFPENVANLFKKAVEENLISIKNIFYYPHNEDIRDIKKKSKDENPAYWVFYFDIKNKIIIQKIIKDLMKI